MVDLSGQLLLGVVAGAAGGVARQAVELRAAEQRMHRLILKLALEIVQRRLNAVDHDRAQTNAAPEVSALVHAPPQLRDVINVLADEDGLEEIDDGRNGFGAKVARVGLAQSRVRAVGENLDERGATQLARLAEEWVVGARSGEEDGADVSDGHGERTEREGSRHRARRSRCTAQASAHVSPKQLRPYDGAACPSSGTASTGSRLGEFLRYARSDWA